MKPNDLPEWAKGLLHPKILMRDCPKYDKCRAQICPLDNWQERVMLEDDTVCFYLIESVKEGGDENFRGVGLENFFYWMVTLAPEISSRHPRISRTLERAKGTGSRMMKGVKLKKGGADHE